MTVMQVNTSRDALALVDKYEAFVHYLYPMLINMSRKHRVLRDEMLQAMLDQYKLFYEAAKSRQISRVYLADAGLARMRGILRLLSNSRVRLLSLKQYDRALILLSEVGSMVNAWIDNFKR